MNTLPLATTSEIYLEEAKMVAAKQTQESNTNTAAMGIPLGSAFIKEAELWMGAHKDFLTSMEAMMTDWLRRQREVFDTSSRSIRKIYDSRSFIDLVQAQHEWVSDCLQWAAFDTDRSIDSLTASGMPEAQAQALTALLKQFRDMDLSSLATKSDVAETRADLLHDIVDTRTDLGQTKADLLRGFAETKSEIRRWMIGMIGGAVVINTVIVFVVM